MQILTAVGAIIFFIYYLLIISYAGITADFAWIWLFGAITSAGGFLLLRYQTAVFQYIPREIKLLAAILLVAGMLVFVHLLFQVIQGMQAKGSRQLEYVVVLGAQVRGEKPSKALRKRLKSAYRYAKENKNTRLILSGGQGPGEDISEAECMRRYLEKAGIEPERLILEDRSVNTRQNLVFSNELTGCAKARTGILSNDFHICRALALAKKQGYLAAEGIAAESDPIMQIHYVVREVFALIKEKVRGNI